MNRIRVTGTVKEIAKSHKNESGQFYLVKISSRRLSGTEDIIPCMVKGKIINNFTVGEKVLVSGEIRTRNVHDSNGKSHLQVNVYVKGATKEFSGFENDINDVVIHGFLCKKCQVRETPLGRTIFDFIIASNRSKTKSDYIPCLSWGNKAIEMSYHDLGTEFILQGRFQSRQYMKPDTEEVYEVYEFSVSDFSSKMEEEEC